MILSDLDNIVYNKFANGEITLTEYIKYQNRDKMINYEKKYNEALGWMQSLYKGLHGITKEDAEHYFPELKESEDGRIRKAIIAYISHGQHCGVSNTDMITWLEKQGEQHSSVDTNKMVDEFAHTEVKGYGIPSMIEVDAYRKGIEDALKKQCKHPTDKVERKFNVGDWVVQENIGTYKVIEVCESWYEVIDNQNNHYSIGFDKEDMCHLWTIQDAKDGDVLASKDGDDILIFRNIDTSVSFSSYYNIVRKGESNWDNTRFFPATKEQHDLLFAKMKDSGYEWSDEKKELKKIEPKTLNPGKVIEWLKTKVYDDSTYGRAMIEQFKNYFGL